MARGGQRCHCFSRNASFIRTVFCEYTLYFFCSFFCDFLLFLLMVSPSFGIVLPFTVFWLGGSERRSLEADCKPQKKNCAALAAWRVVLCSLSQQQRDYLKCGLENVLRMSPTRSLLCVLLGGADPVMRRVWTLACDCETRRCAAILRPVLPRAVGGAMSYVAAQQLRAFDLWHGYLASYSR